MKHYPAFRCIETRIELLNKEIIKTKESLKIDSESEFLKTDKENLTNEVDSLKLTLIHLVK